MLLISSCLIQFASLKFKMKSFLEVQLVFAIHKTVLRLGKCEWTLCILIVLIIAFL